jgi:hypothetical protein
MKLKGAAAAGAAALGVVTAYDLTQRRHAILRNFPVVGHLRFFLERFGPELRQYIVTSNDEERPFSRDQRRWVYASSKLENNYFGFGTDNDTEHLDGYPIIKHRTFAGEGASTMRHTGEEIPLPSAKVLGRPTWPGEGVPPGFGGQHLGHELRRALGQRDRGAEQGRRHGRLPAQRRRGRPVVAHHRHGGDVIFQIGTAYFGCRDEHGHFSLDKLKQVVDSAP